MIPKGDRHTREEIGGIPAYSSAPSIRYTGALLFRVGRADETARNGGLSHLVEHLALFHLGSHQPYAFNGSVSGLSTIFVATGNPEEVGRFLTEVGKGLQNLPMHRLVDEARVLRTEALRRSTDPNQQLLWMRYGATTHGLHQLSEFGLVNPDPQSVATWAAERFTAGNAALWFTGPLPRNFELDLPRGERMKVPEPIPRSDLKLPAAGYWRQNLVALSFVVPRKSMFNFLLKIAAGRISSKLRFEKGISYEIRTAYEPITRDEVHSAIWASCLPEHAATVRDGIVGVFDELAANGATDAELRDIRDQALRSWADPGSLARELGSRAWDELLGFETRSLADILAEFSLLDRTEVARRISAAHAHSLMMIPDGCPAPSGRFLPARWSERAVSGTTYRATSARFPWSNGPRLVIGRDGVSVLDDHRRPVTISFASCAVAVGHKDGSLELLEERGAWLRIVPRGWRRGAEAVAMLKRFLPPDRLVRQS